MILIGECKKSINIHTGHRLPGWWPFEISILLWPDVAIYDVSLLSLSACFSAWHFSFRRSRSSFRASDFDDSARYFWGKWERVKPWFVNQSHVSSLTWGRDLRRQLVIAIHVFHKRVASVRVPELFSNVLAYEPRFFFVIEDNMDVVESARVTDGLPVLLSFWFGVETTKDRVWIHFKILNLINVPSLLDYTNEFLSKQAKFLFRDMSEIFSSKFKQWRRTQPGWSRRQQWWGQRVVVNVQGNP